MLPLIIADLGTADETVEIVERKGLGHPDTICDALAETLSRNLCREYQGRFGAILHHNVDKALLSGGRAAPGFGGGTVLAPIHIYLAGRAVTNVGDESLPIEEIAVEGSRLWLRTNLHALDVERHVQVHALIHPGSSDLQALFARDNKQGVPLANDTSFGVGYAPMSPLERLVLAAERRINGRNREQKHLAWGEDVKIMSAWIKENVERPLIIGPDSESEQWVSAVASDAGAPYSVLEKVRHGDRDVTITLKEMVPRRGGRRSWSTTLSRVVAR